MIENTFHCKNVSFTISSSSSFLPLQKSISNVIHFAINFEIINFIQLLIILLISIILIDPSNASSLDYIKSKIPSSIFENSPDESFLVDVQSKTHCSKKNSSNMKNSSSTSSSVDENVSKCDLFDAENLLSSTCRKNCSLCHERSFLFTSKKISSHVTISASSSTINSMKQQIDEPINFDAVNDKSKVKCLIVSTVHQLCNLNSFQRIIYANSIHLKFCSAYSLKIVINSTWTMANYDDCSYILNSLLDDDNLAAKLYCQFNLILNRYNCQSGYSVKWNCTSCSKAYHDWICSTVFPYYHIVDGKYRKPCKEFCERVEKRCPYFHPSIGDQYAGEPVFSCTDPQIPFLTDENVINHENNCYTPCDLKLSTLRKKFKYSNDDEDALFPFSSISNIQFNSKCWPSSIDDDEDDEYNECKYLTSDDNLV